MCDCLLATPAVSARGALLFAKNSDRQRNEAQVLEYRAGARFPEQDTLRCTYITIPQVAVTHAVLLSRPFWMWGAEMGSNECGVVIGNEGLHAKSHSPQESALTGMDLVRLGLERACTAAAAVAVITELLERFGQGGNGGHVEPAYYNNGFLIADAREAYVLETVEREWVLERVRETRSMSNIYSIGREAHSVSPGFARMLAERGWSTSDEPDYARAITNPDREHIGHAGARRSRSAEHLRRLSAGIEPADLMAILRDHGFEAEASSCWHPEQATSNTLCMHAGTQERPGQTVASWVSEVDLNGAIHWVTATAAPCLSIFKPVLWNADFPLEEPTPTDYADMHTLWWQHERLHRAALQADFGALIKDIRAERQALETEFRKRILGVIKSTDRAARSSVVRDCWQQARETEERWRKHLVGRTSANRLYQQTWNSMSEQAGLHVAF